MHGQERDKQVRDGLGALLPRLRRFARTLVREPAEADDLVQVALERALARAHQWDAARSLDGWVFGILRNAWLDALRAGQRAADVFAPAEWGEDAGHAPDGARDLAMSLRAALARLPEEQRSAVALVLVEGLSYQEAADALGVPVGTVTSRLSRGRAALQAALSEGGWP